MDVDPPSGQTVALPNPPPGWHDRAFAVTPTGQLVLVRCDRDELAEYRVWYERVRDWDPEQRKRGESAPVQRGRSGTRLRLSRFDGTAEFDAIEIPYNAWPKVVPLPDGGWLIPSNGRFRRYSREGEPGGSIDLGGYMEHVVCTESGKIWVGYFDEGVFANVSPDGNIPYSTAGIASFSPDGDVLWRFNWRDDLSLYDCYNLTIDGERVWSCPYGDPNFPIVLIENHQVRLWGNDLIGIKALAADGEHVILAGGYNEDSNRIALLRLGDSDAVLVSEWRFQQPGKYAAQLMQGTGATLHLVGDGRWQRVTIRDLLEAARKKSTPRAFGVL